MKAVGKELKWALCGFIGGWVLCCFFIGSLKTPTSPARVALLQTTTGVLEKPLIIHVERVCKTIEPFPVDGTIGRDHPYLETPELRNVPQGTLPKTYSVNLIDGRDQAPQMK